MNYAAHYDRLINRARNRTLNGYVERHHVHPKCMGGGDEIGNIVRLTGREHWLAHKLLIFIHPNNRRLIHAAVWMASRSANGHVYEWLRRLNAKTVGDAHRGKVCAPFTESHRAKIGAAHRGRKHSPEHCARNAAARIGKKRGAQSAEDRAKKSLARIGARHSPETIEKLRGTKSKEHRDKLSAAAKLRPPVSAESKAKRLVSYKATCASRNARRAAQLGALL